MLMALDGASWWWPALVGGGALFAIFLHAWIMRRRAGTPWRPAPDMPYRHLLVQCTGGNDASDDLGHTRFSSVSTMNAEIGALASGRVITLWGKCGGRGALMPIDGRYWHDGGAIDDLAAAYEGRGRTYRDPLDQNATWYDDLHFSTLEARRLLWGWSVARIRDVVRKPV
jgi:hypothetical protein